MSIQSTIEADYKKAFKANDRSVVSALRMLKSAIKNREIEIGREMTDEETVEIIARESKRRNDASAQYTKAGRNDLAAHEQDDVTAYRKYLPAPLSEDELTKLVTEAATTLGAKDSSSMGKVMGAVMPKVKGRADGASVQAVVRRVLGA
ncbi:MAG: GatB/YqeY domain-containing protein [Candidatus Kerfeldbacteria bacterium]